MSLDTRTDQQPLQVFTRAKRLRRSALLGLVLIGVAACGEKSPRRDQYANKADCEADWGDPSRCEEAPTSKSGTSSSSRHYYGPIYQSRDQLMSQYGRPTVLNRSTGSHSTGSRSSGSVSRGGFGSSSSAHSGGG
jgi:uncharacterized protein YgiB involved in biofilm formation